MASAGLNQAGLSRRIRIDPAILADDTAGSSNMLQLVQLRWVAAIGQVVTIAFVELALGISLPLGPMALVVAFLVALNAVSVLRLRSRTPVGNAGLFIALALDIAALTVQLYLSGGVTNPFISLYLLQVTLAAVLLEVWWATIMVAITGGCFVGLTLFYRPLALPTALNADPFKLHLQGLLVCFLLDAALLVIFVTRITGNLSTRDAHLARLRQHAAEESHIVRMGLLASGAAHELGTPLSTVSVILGDWQREPVISTNPDLARDITDMQAALMRCKSIISGILLSAGEVRGDAPAITTVATFLSEFVDEWVVTRPNNGLVFANNFGPDVPIVADRALRQILANLLDNAHEAPSPHIRLSARRSGGDLVLTVSDDGPGFAPEILAHFGHPYHSTKGRLGGGLGLFLVVNVVRKLGGNVTAQNRMEGGATVALTLPLDSLQIEEDIADA